MAVLEVAHSGSCVDSCMVGIKRDMQTCLRGVLGDVLLIAAAPGQHWVATA